MSSIMKRRNILQLMRDRELSDHVRFKYALKDKINSHCVSKIGLITELEGHRGCVNCLQWNENGSILASASDDYQVILWDPFLQKIKTTIKTLHRGNIFTVKFIPSCNDDIVATGAGDWNTHTYNVTTGNRLSVCTCSRGRVKRIAVINDTPSVYWSASEDGCIRQHDMRMNHDCTSDQSKINLVSIYNDTGSTIEAKCLDINQLRTEQLAVGANDPYVRLYDRRMIRSLSSFTIQHPIPKNPSEFVFKFNDNNTTFKNNHTPDNIVQYFVPGHIHLDEPKLTNKNINIGITYLTFSPDGQELLVNYGSEYVYLYNLLNQEENAFCNIPRVMKTPREYGEGTSTDTIDEPVPHITLPDNIEKLKLKANYLFEKKDYTAAIDLYNEAIDIFKCSVLFSNRAAAYIKRKWHGDFYAALKDCVTALKLEPNHMKAHFRLAVCLYELNKLKDSKMYLEQFTKKYPSYKNSAAYKVLHNGLLEAQRNENKTDETKRTTSERNRGSEEDRTKVTQPEKATLEGYFRNQAKDYHHRYYGHCNTSTDIKEANFFGNQYIVAGSDDGLFFIWDKNTENNVLVLRGDNSIVNCLQPHPSEFMLATSGIDNEVKLWGPLPEDKNNAFEVRTYESTAMMNQTRMMTDPFELMIRNIHRPLIGEIEMDGVHYVNEEFEDGANREFYTCRTS